jgi:hypothetical protein
MTKLFFGLDVLLEATRATPSKELETFVYQIVYLLDKTLQTIRGIVKSLNFS